MPDGGTARCDMRAGELPPAEDNGTRYVKIPLNHVRGFSTIASEEPAA